MYILWYLLAALMMYFIGSFILLVRLVYKVRVFFKDNPNTLPLNIPDYVKDFKEGVGEYKFKELYKSFQDDNG
jgi:hypothetical protein